VWETSWKRAGEHPACSVDRDQCVARRLDARTALDPTAKIAVLDGYVQGRAKLALASQSGTTAA
jgi:hypothetical protein